MVAKFFLVDFFEFRSIKEANDVLTHGTSALASAVLHLLKEAVNVIWAFATRY